jgi:Co/Zn/Cd efflux system component
MATSTSAALLHGGGCRVSLAWWSRLRIMLTSGCGSIRDQLAIAAVVLASGWGLARDSVNLALDGVPKGIELADVKDYLGRLEGVTEVHDLHVWTVTSGVIAMSAHAIVRQPDHNHAVLEAATRQMGTLGIGHVTMQLEPEEMCLNCEVTGHR